MDDLTSRQRATLRSLAHSLRPVVQIGREGVSDSVVRTVTETLNTRELLKVRSLETAPASAAELGRELANSIEGTHLVQVIGRTMVLYRRHPVDPQIVLPGS